MRRFFFFRLLLFILMTKSLLAILAIVSVVLSICPANYDINNLVAGISSIKVDSLVFSVDQNSSLSSKTYNYAFQNNFAAAPSLGLGKSTFIQLSPTYPLTISVLIQLAYNLSPSKIQEFSFNLTILQESGRKFVSFFGLATIIKFKSELSILTIFRYQTDVLTLIQPLHNHLHKLIIQSSESSLTGGMLLEMQLPSQPVLPISRLPS